MVSPTVPKHPSLPIPTPRALSSIHLASLNADPLSAGRRKAKIHQNDFILWAKLVLSTTGQLLSAAIMSPLTFLSDPLSTTYTVLVFPILFAVLLVVQVVLLILKVAGFDDLANTWAKQYNDGFGPANWGNAPNLAPQVSRPIMNRMRPVLNKEQGTTFDSDDVTRIVRYFDIDVAQGLLLMSSLVYERDAHQVHLAAEAVTDVDTTRLLTESEAKIRRVAAEWNMSFKCVTEMKTVGGPYAGLFYPSNGERWMVLAFKGTTPNNYSEWLVDTNFTKTNANVYLDGNVHEGFYSSIFPDHDDPESPYSRMIDFIQITAAGMRAGAGPKINLWVTGHSLGSALAGVMFARLLKSPADLGEDVCLRHAYLYGTPRLGDIDFCSKVASDTITPITRDQIMWRIADNSDIVTRVPPGLGDDPRLQTSIPPNSLLNYGHVGAGIHLLVKKPPLYIFPSKEPYTMDTRFFIGADVKIVAAPRGHVVPTNAQARNPITILLQLMPPFIQDHLPYRYFERLERLLPLASQYGAHNAHNAYT